MFARLAGVAAVIASTAIASAEPLSADDLAKKDEGGYVTGLPLAAYSTDIGVGVGARAYYYWDGDRKDARFATTPYLFRTFLQVFASTRGIQFHWLDFDIPKVFDSPYRFRSQIIYARNINQNYFGVGDRSLAPLKFPGSPSSYDTFSAFSDAENVVLPDGSTYSKYNQYDLLKPTAIASVERLLLDDRLRVLGGLGFSYVRVHDYTNKQIDDANGVSGIENQTKLAEDCAAKTIVGCNALASGQFENYLRLGVSYDTRDFEPDPNTGVFIDGEADIATIALGSSYDYIRGLIAARGYLSPFDGHDIVLAGRFVIVGQTNGAPFFSMDNFPFTDDPRQGLGGHRTLRGYRQDRFIGSVMTVINAEVRWTFAHATWWRQKFAFIAAPFVDAGRPYDSLAELTYKDWKPSYGAALRISWNLATIATIDYGISPEDSGLYINFNHIF
ncbi:MAG: BamA/TamA family outer membrane protein [Kofleriaceae bacterium]